MFNVENRPEGGANGTLNQELKTLYPIAQKPTQAIPRLRIRLSDQNDQVFHTIGDA